MSLLGAGAFSIADSVGTCSIGGQRAFSFGALEHRKDGVSFLGARAFSIAGCNIGSWSIGG